MDQKSTLVTRGKIQKTFTSEQSTSTKRNKKASQGGWMDPFRFILKRLGENKKEKEKRRLFSPLGVFFSFFLSFRFSFSCVWVWVVGCGDFYINSIFSLPLPLSSFHPLPLPLPLSFWLLHSETIVVAIFY